MHLAILVKLAFVLTIAINGANAFTTDVLRSLADKQSSNSSSSGSFDGTNGKWFISKKFDASNCSGVPNSFVASPGCTFEVDGQCVGSDFTYTSSSSSSGVAHSYDEFICVDSYSTALSVAYGDTQYIRNDFYNDKNCSELSFVNVYAVDAKCHNFVNGSIPEDANPASMMFAANANGSIVFSLFTGFDCADLFSEYLYTTEHLQSGECREGSIASTNPAINESGSSTGSDKSAGAIITVAYSCAALIGAITLLVL